MKDYIITFKSGEQIKIPGDVADRHQYDGKFVIFALGNKFVAMYSVDEISAINLVDPQALEKKPEEPPIEKVKGEVVK